MFTMRLFAKSCLTRKSGLRLTLTQAYSSKDKSSKFVKSEVDVDNTEQIDALEEEINAENYNKLFYNLHNQKLPESPVGIDLDNFDAIESYDKLFLDSYNKHQVNTEINKQIMKLAEQSDLGEELECQPVVQNTNISKPDVNVNRAEGRIFVGEEAMKSIIGSKGKGDILTVAEVAGILGAKKTSELVPHYFSNVVHKVEIAIDLDIRTFEVIVTAKVTGDDDCRTKALTGCTIALVTIFDHLKDVSKDIHMKSINLKD